MLNKYLSKKRCEHVINGFSGLDEWSPCQNPGQKPAESPTELQEYADTIQKSIEADEKQFTSHSSQWTRTSSVPTECDHRPQSHKL